VGIKITDLKDLKPKMAEAFAMKDRLVFLDIQVDTSEHVYPMQIRDGSMRDMWLSKTERT
jgi:acetolactate synthase-1/2/3 large subunit